MSQAANIDRALVARLAGDGQLHGFLPDGVYLGAAPQGLTRFALVAHVSSSDQHVFGDPQHRRAWEENIYAVAAVTQGPGTGPANDAAAKIDELLVDAPLTVTGYDCLLVERVSRIVAVPMVDAVDPTIVWQQCGGQYRVLMTPV